MFAEKYNGQVISVYAPGDSPFEPRWDFIYLFSVFLWPIFGVVFGVLMSFLHNQERRIAIHLFWCIGGIGFIFAMSELSGLLFWSDAENGLFAWYEGVQGRLNLSYLSCVSWPMCYFVAFASSVLFYKYLENRGR